MDYLQYSDIAKDIETLLGMGFKPCYKWITFNTLEKIVEVLQETKEVLNLVINGLPSILYSSFVEATKRNPSSFKPCYKWITFNTITEDDMYCINAITF